MEILNLIIQNKELLKIIYALIIITICLVIVLKTHKLFHLSLHQGIRYFRNAFFFYGLGFFVRYILGMNYLDEFFGNNYYLLIDSLFQFFLIMGGFFLLYSMIWKKIDANIKHTTSLFHGRIIMFYIMAIVIIGIDLIWRTYIYMFISQIILFLFAVLISYSNYKNKKQGKFLKYYLIAMIMSLAAWVMNGFIAIFYEWNQAILSASYLLNIIVFFLFLIGVIKFTK